MSDGDDDEGADQVPSPDNLNPEEVEAAVQALSDGDRRKLFNIEKIFRRGTTLGPHELLHEALCSAMLGDRKWPRQVAPIAFLIKTMSSLAFHERQKRRREMAAGASSDLVAVASAGPLFMGQTATPEEILLLREEKETVDQILRCFEDDQEAQLVILGWSAGYRGKELRGYVGVDQAALDYAIKRIRREMSKRYPDGWTK